MTKVNRDSIVKKIVELTEKGNLTWIKRTVSLSFNIQKSIWTSKTDDDAFHFECIEEERKVKIFSTEGECTILIDNEFESIFESIKKSCPDEREKKKDILDSLGEMG